MDDVSSALKFEYDFERESIASVLTSVRSAQSKFEQLDAEIKALEAERKVYSSALIHLGEELASMIKRRVPISGHLVSDRDGRKFLVDEVKVRGGEWPRIRLDAAQNVIVSGPILTTKGKISTGGWRRHELLTRVEDLGPFDRKTNKLVSQPQKGEKP